MSRLVKTTKYSNRKEILKVADHFVALKKTFKMNDAAATTVEGRKIIKAGTVYPQNDATAIGMLLYDVDVTEGDADGALLVHGIVDKNKIPAPIAELAAPKIPLIIAL